MDVRRDEDEAGIRASQSQIEWLLDEEVRRGTSPERIVLAGFSQGGAMAYQVGLRYANTLAGILVLSAYLLLPEKLDAESSAANRSTPILQCHGTFDPVVPLAMGEQAARTLGELGYTVEWKTYPAPHGLHPDELVDISQWLRERLSV